MTTDERIDKLTERTEALTQSVELLASFNKDNQQMIVSLARDVQMLVGTVSRLEQLSTAVGEGTLELIRMGRDHEQRITRLERAS